MSKVVVVLLVVCGLFGSFAFASSVGEIIQLCEAGMAEDLVIAAAQNQSMSNIAADQMLAVKAACKSDNVLRALMQRPVRNAVNTVSLAINSPGFYLVNNGPSQELQPTTFTGGAKVKKGLGNLASLAIAKLTYKGELRGATAKVRASRQPEFLTDDSGYLLVRLKAKGEKREVAVGTGGLMGVHGNFKEESLINFVSARTPEGRFRITFTSPLELGEYAFYPANGFQAGGENLNLTGKVYDFGVD